MLSDYERTVELIDVAYDSAGKAAEQFGKYQDTVEYRINQVSNKWEQFRTSLLDSSTYKGALDLLGGLLDSLNKVDFGRALAISPVAIIAGKMFITNFIKGAKQSVIATQQIGTGIVNVIGNIFSKSKLGTMLNFEMSKKNIQLQIQTIQKEIENQAKIKVPVALNVEGGGKLSVSSADLGNILKDFDIYSPDFNVIDTLQQKLGLTKDSVEALRVALSNNTNGIRDNMIAARENAIALEEYNKKAKVAAANAQFLGSALQSVGSSLALMLSTFVATGDFEEATEVASKSLIAMAAQMAIQAALMAVQAKLQGTAIGKAFGDGINIGLASTGIGLIIAGAMALLAGLVFGLGKLNQQMKKSAQNSAALSNNMVGATLALEELEEKQEELNVTLDEANTKYDEAKENLDTIKEFKEETEEYNNTLTMTSEQLEEWKEKQNEIAALFPELISHYDEEGNAILEVGAIWDEIIAKKKEYYDISALEQSQAQLGADIGNYASAAAELARKEAIGETFKEHSAYLMAFSEIEDANIAGLDKGALNTFREDELTNPKLAARNIEADSQLTMVGWLKTLSEEQSVVQGELFKNILIETNSALADEVKDLQGSQVIDKIIALLKSGSETEEQEIRNQLSDAIQAFGEIDLSPEMKNLKAMEDKLSSSISGYVEAQLGVNETFTSADKNIQNIMTKVATSSDDLGFGDIISNFEEKMKKENEDWFDENGEIIATYYDEYSKELQKQFDAEGISDELLELIDTTFDDSALVWLDSFYKGVIDGTLNLSDKINQILGSDLPQVIKDALILEFEDDTAEEQRRIGILSSAYGEEPTFDEDSGLLTSSGSIDKWYSELGLAAQEAFWNSFNNLDEEKQSSEYIDAVKRIIDSADTNVQAPLLSKDYSSLSASDMLLSREQDINNIVDNSNYSREEAAALIDAMNQEMLKYNNTAIDSRLEIDMLNEKIKEVRDNTSTLGDTLFAAVKEITETGVLSLETVGKLEEENLRQFISITETGFSLDTSAATKYFIEQNKLAKELYEVEKRNAELEVIRLQAKQSQLEVTAKQRKIEIQAELSRAVSTQTALALTAEQKEIDKELLISREENKIELEKHRDILAEIVELEPYHEMMAATAIAERLQELNNELEQSEESAKNAQESYNDAVESLGDLEEKLREAEKALHDATYGTDNFQSGLDRLINKSEQLKIVERNIADLKESFDAATEVEQFQNLTSALETEYTKQATIIEATIKAQQDTLANIDQELASNFGDYVSFGEDGSMAIDFAYTEMPNADEIREAFEELVTKRVEVVDSLYEEQQALKAVQEEWQALYENTRSDYITVQEKVLDILKKNAEDEVKITQDKYSALAEADNNYLDALSEAIEKQRKLREQEDKYGDLATQEKRLSLMQRDTSGANQKEVLQLEKDITESRENILDMEVDNFLESMRELYETQQEARDAELEYLDALMESTDWWVQVNEIMSNFKTQEDAIAWFMENDSSVQEMSVEQTEAFLEEIEGYYVDTQKYLAVTSMNIAESIQADADKIDETFRTLDIDTTVGTQIVNLAEIAKTESIAAAQDAMTAAQEALSDGQEKAQEYKEAWDEAEQLVQQARIDNAKISTDLLNELSDTANDAMVKTSSFAFTEIAKWSGLDLQNEEDRSQFMENYGDKFDYTSAGFMAASGQMTSQEISIQENKEQNESLQKTQYNQAIEGGSIQSGGLSREQFLGYASKFNTEGHGILYPDGRLSMFETEVERNETFGYNRMGSSGAIKFKNGGLVDFTGPAWVDGTKSKPEAFLNAEQTQTFSEFITALQSMNNRTNSISDIQNSQFSTAATSNIEITFNIDNIDSDYSVDRMMERVQQTIYDTANPIGSSVILRK